MLYNIMVNNDAVSTDAQMELIAELIATVKDFERIFGFIMDAGSDLTEAEQARKNAAFPVLFALYEKVSDIYRRLDADSTIGNLLVAKGFDYMIDEQTTTQITVDRLYYNVRRMFVSIMRSSSLTDDDGNSRLAWDVYVESTLSTFFAIAADLMLAGFDGELYAGANVVEIMAMFDALDSGAKYAFFEFGAQEAYYDALMAYFNAQLPQDVAETEIVKAIFNAQIFAIALSMENNAENVANFTESMASAIEKYDALANEQILPAQLLAIYNACLAVYNELVPV